MNVYVLTGYVQYEGTTLLGVLIASFVLNLIWAVDKPRIAAIVHT